MFPGEAEEDGDGQEAKEDAGDADGEAGPNFPRGSEEEKGRGKEEEGDEADDEEKRGHEARPTEED